MWSTTTAEVGRSKTDIFYFTTWSNVPTSLLETLVIRILKQMFEVINKNTGAPHY